MPPGQQGRGRSRLRQKTTPRAGASAPRPRRRRRLRATASVRAKAAAKALAEKNTRRHARRAACRSLNELARKLHVSASNLVDAKNAAATEVEDLVKLVEKRVQTDADVASLRSVVETYVANGGVFKAPLLDPEDVLPAKVGGHRILKPGFELKSKAFMLTYNSFSFSPATWDSFLSYMKELRQKLGARAWSACLEQSLHADSGAADRYHLHGYLLWTDGVGVHTENLDPFVFQTVRPRIDVCVTKTSTVSPHTAATHGLWYVWLRKTGTLFNATNYEAGVWYKPQATWLQNLYQDKKLTYERYMEISAKDFPLGHSARKRDAAEALRDTKARAVGNLVSTELALLKSGNDYQQPRIFPEVVEFVDKFRAAAWRRPALLILGATNLGKSMLAASVLEQVGVALGLPSAGFAEVTVEDDEHIDFSDLDPEKHAGMLLDGVSDVKLLQHNRETLQGRPKQLKGARSATMKFSFPFALCRRAVVITMDLSAKNLHLLSTDHWLKDRRNIIQLRLTERAYGSAGAGAGGAPARDNRDLMAEWSVAAVSSFLQSADLEGPSQTLFNHGVAGVDLLAFTAADLTNDLRLSAFTARKVLAARDRYLGL